MFFTNLKEKDQKAYRIGSYDEILLNTISSMFAYQGKAFTDVDKTDIDVGFMESIRILKE